MNKDYLLKKILNPNVKMYEDKVCIKEPNSRYSQQMGCCMMGGGKYDIKMGRIIRLGEFIDEPYVLDPNDIFSDYVEIRENQLYICIENVELQIGTWGQRIELSIPFASEKDIKSEVEEKSPKSGRGKEERVGTKCNDR